MKVAKAASKQFKHILSPIQVGPISLKNRIFVSAHQPVLAENGLPTEEYIKYHQNIAAGGAALQITGAQSVHPTGMNEYNCLVNHDDSIIPGYKELAKAVHEKGGRILAQLSHFGATGWTGILDEPAWAASPVASEVMRVIPHEMTALEIQEVVEAFGSAAKRAKEGGLDGVEITAAHGMLIASFLSGYANHRNDNYGGSLNNRLRFLLEIIDSVHSQVGDDFIIGIRFSADEKVDGGINISEAKEIARRLESTNKVDYLNVISGTNLDRIQRWEHWPATPAPYGLFADLAKEIKDEVSIPVFAVGRITEPALAEEIVSNEYADMVAMTRGHIADPYIVKKIQEDRVEDIRPCIGSNYCIKQVLQSKPVRCLYNPEAGRSNKLGSILPTDNKKKVVIVGGGPAGLEAARVSAMRGHEVTLFEKSDKLGGQLSLWSNTPTMKEFKKSLKWFQLQLEKYKVNVHLNTEVSKYDLMDLDVDEIIIATGADAMELGSKKWLPKVYVNENSSIEIITPSQMLKSNITEFKKAAIWDWAGGEAGSQTAMSAAELLAKDGVKVEIISPFFTIAEDIHPTLRSPLYKRLLSTGVVFKPNSELKSINKDDLVIRNIYSNEEETIENVDVLVPWLGNQVNDNLYKELVESGLENIHLLGDAVAPRTVETATHEGAKLARKL
ncbi:FAD-dependent oxidoreductase [Oceanobacillus luteolus]|uniref:FAD-dependent oxidoreductase n=1 Tax=Oceanobacillus luteolus TaxID=1274358 RepID=A0ABW4HQM5_9BACI